jgi:MFS family permease
MSSQKDPSAAPFSPSWLTPRIAALGASIVALLLYLVTMNRTIGFIDKGEMAAVSSTLGIAHPTGYPTMMLLGFLFTRLADLFGIREILALNIMAALLTAAGVGVMSLLFDYLLRRVSSARPSGQARPATQRPAAGTKGAKRVLKDPPATPAPISVPVHPSSFILHPFFAPLAALVVAFSSVWWNQGNGIEVYSLHALLMPLAMLLFLRYMEESETESAAFTRRGTLFAVALGLSFTNHMTTILLAPAFLYYFFRRFGLNAAAFRRIGYLIPPFLLGLLPYAWLPIRASMDPMFNWGDPDSFKRFFDHVSGKQYRVWMFSSSREFWQQTTYFFGSLPLQIAVLGMLVAPFGIAYAWRRNRDLLVWSILLFVACVIYAGGYSIADIESYYMLAILAIGIWIVWGLRWIADRYGASAALGIGAVMVIAGAALNYGNSDESGNYTVEDYSVNMLRSLPPNSLVFSSEWNFWVSASWYLQAIEKVRPDVLVLDQELLRRSWYIDHIRNNHPEFMKIVEPEVNSFLKQAYLFEHDLPYDAATIQGAYIGMINAMIDRSIATRPVFVTGEVDPEMGKRYTRTPNHLALRLVTDTTYLAETFPSYQFRPWEGRIDDQASRIYEFYARSMIGRALYERQFGHDSLATRYYSEALRFDPGYSEKDVPDLPLNREDQILGTIRLFQELRRQLGRE